MTTFQPRIRHVGHEQRKGTRQVVRNKLQAGRVVKVYKGQASETLSPRAARTLM